MPTSFNHPTFGAFQQKDSHFSTTLTIPAFKKFSYDTGYSNARRSTGKITLSFGPYGMNEKLPKPTARMIKLAEELLADPENLVAMIAQALWDDFNGRGPTVGMWWHGDMDTINDAFRAAKLPPPTKPDDILGALRLSEIHILTQLDDHPNPVAVLTFDAAFEEEHGLCVVTDGKKVLGSSYGAEPEIGQED